MAGLTGGTAVNGGMAWGHHSIGTPGRLDEDAERLLAKVVRNAQPPIRSLPPLQARQEFQRWVTNTNPVPPPGVIAEDIAVAGPGGALRLRLYRPTAADQLPALLYFHGGGFVVGDLDSHDPICRCIAVRTRSLVVAVDYRRAPEHPYPAAVEDALAALDWLAAHRGALAATDVLGVGGDSAGGTLAAVAAQHARDRALALALQILVYPAVDQGGAYPSRTAMGDGFLMTMDDVTWFSRHYFGTAAPVLAPWASPLRAPSLAGLAPALALTAGFDPLRDEGRAYADSLLAAGVPVRHVCLEGTLHGCLGMARLLAAGQRALDEVCAAWTAAAAGPTSAGASESGPGPGGRTPVPRPPNE